jgi:hypothetical protein
LICSRSSVSSPYSAFVIGVMTKPGAIAFTRMSGANSLAAQRVSALTPALAAQ